MSQNSIFKLIARSFFILTLLSLIACNSDIQRQWVPDPNAIGKANQLVVLCDENLWETSLGDTVSYYYESPYPILPQPEPNFDLRQFTHQDLIENPVYRELRAFLVLANLSDKNSPATQMVLKDIGEQKVLEAIGENGYGVKSGLDKWAKGQIVLYLFAENIDDLMSGVVASYPAFSERLRAYDKDQLDATVYLEGLDVGLMEKVKSGWGVEIRIPKNFELALEKDEFLWLRYEQPKISNSLIFYKIPYNDPQQLTKEGIKELRDSITKNVTSSVEDTYVKINDEALPLFFYQKELDGHFCGELRGIWEMENDFLGGPFHSYAILAEEKGEIVFIDAFVYAPGEKKRDPIQKLAHIVSTTKLSD